MPSQLTNHVFQLLQAEGFRPERIVEQRPQPIAEFVAAQAELADLDPVQSLRMSVEGKTGAWICVLRVFEATERLVVYSILPRNAELAQRERIALLLTQINYGLVLGNFEMDMTDGEIRYKTSMDAEGIELNNLVLRNLMYGNFFSVDLYHEAILAGMDSQRDLTELVFEAEHPDQNQGFDLVDDIVH